MITSRATMVITQLVVEIVATGVMPEA